MNYKWEEVKPSYLCKISKLLKIIVKEVVQMFNYTHIA